MLFAPLLLAFASDFAVPAAPAPEAALAALDDAFLALNKGRMTLITDRGMESVMGRRGDTPLVERGHLLVGTTGEAELVWIGRGSLKVTGAASVEWHGSPFEEQPLGLFDFTRAQLEVRTGELGMRLPGGVLLVAERVVVELVQRSSGVFGVHHMAGKPLRIVVPAIGQPDVRTLETGQWLWIDPMDYLGRSRFEYALSPEATSESAATASAQPESMEATPMRAGSLKFASPARPVGSASVGAAPLPTEQVPAPMADAFDATRWLNPGAERQTRTAPPWPWLPKNSQPRSTEPALNTASKAPAEPTPEPAIEAPSDRPSDATPAPEPAPTPSLEAALDAINIELPPGPSLVPPPLDAPAVIGMEPREQPATWQPSLDWVPVTSALRLDGLETALEEWQPAPDEAQPTEAQPTDVVDELLERPSASETPEAVEVDPPVDPEPLDQDSGAEQGAPQADVVGLGPAVLAPATGAEPTLAISPEFGPALARANLRWLRDVAARLAQLQLTLPEPPTAPAPAAQAQPSRPVPLLVVVPLAAGPERPLFVRAYPLPDDVFLPPAPAPAPAAPAQPPFELLPSKPQPTLSDILNGRIERR